MKLTMSIKEFLSASKTKSTLTAMFTQALLEHVASSDTFQLVVAYDTKIKGQDFEENHSHEEADELIPHQVLPATDESVEQEICVWSPDTDVLTHLLDLVSRGHLGANTSLKFLTGKGGTYREIDVGERVRVIARYKSQGLIGLHNFSGADWDGRFVSITKKTWAGTYMTLDEDDPVIDCFRQLGEDVIPNEL